jgi:hypothetical protein
MAISVLPKEILSSSQQRHWAQLKFFLPGLVELFLYMTISLWVLAVINANAFLKFYSVKIAGSQEVINQSLGADISTVSRHLDQAVGNRLGGFIIWFSLGLIIYCFVWLLINIYINVRNDFTAANYVWPDHLNRKSYWQSIVALKTQLAATIVGLVVFIVLLTKFLPRISSYFYKGVVSLPSVRKLHWIILSLIAATLLVYVFILLIRLLRVMWLGIQKGL